MSYIFSVVSNSATAGRWGALQLPSDIAAGTRSSHQPHLILKLLHRLLPAGNLCKRAGKRLAEQGLGQSLRPMRQHLRSEGALLPEKDHPVIGRTDGESSCVSGTPLREEITGNSPPGTSKDSFQARPFYKRAAQRRRGDLLICSPEWRSRKRRRCPRCGRGWFPCAGG